MLGWIKKIGNKDGASARSGSPNPSGSGGNGGPSSRSSGVPDPEPPHDQSRPTVGHARRASSFLDVSVSALIGRGKKREDGGHMSGSSGALSAMDAQRAEKISCVAFKLVREIQRILKEARETQAASAGGAGGLGGPSPRAGVTAAGQKTKITGSGGKASRARPAPLAAGEEDTPAATVKRTRWAGTGELLNLLNGGSPGGSGEAEDRVDSYDTVAEVEANMEDLVEQALRPESHGDLCGMLLEASTGEGYHPDFVKLCVDAGLPSNLVHCLRIMRVIEFESAIHDVGAATVAGGGTKLFADAAREDTKGNNDNDHAGASNAGVDSDVQAGLDAPAGGAGNVDKEGGENNVHGGGTAEQPKEAAAAPSAPLTDRATERIGRLLVTLCKDKTAGVGEQIKQHLPGLLSLAVSAYPPNGAHVQEMARSVIEALMSGCLNSSMVWLLHYNKVWRMTRLIAVCVCMYVCVYSDIQVLTLLRDIGSSEVIRPRSARPSDCGRQSYNSLYLFLPFLSRSTFSRLR